MQRVIIMAKINIVMVEPEIPQNTGNMLGIRLLQRNQISVNSIFCDKKAHGYSPRTKRL